MSHETEKVGGVGLTQSEQEILANLLKHPEIKKMADEIKKKSNERSDK